MWSSLGDCVGYIVYIWGCGFFMVFSRGRSGEVFWLFGEGFEFWYVL